MYPSKRDLTRSLEKLQGTADHMLKIWFVLKQMGMTLDTPVLVTTSSPEQAMKRLFSYGDPDGDLFVPFAHTARFMKMKHDADRSIIQTNINRWAESGSVVGTDPTGYLNFLKAGGGITVKPGRRYPLGLGYGKNGFARDDGSRVAIPDLAFCVWYYRQDELPESGGAEALLGRLQRDLHLLSGEIEAIFVRDRGWSPELQATRLADTALYRIVSDCLNKRESRVALTKESQPVYSLRIQSTMSVPAGPQWLRLDPTEQLRKLLASGSKAILLYGPPRSGKTRAVDKVFPRTDANRETIQIHDGWGYDELMVSFRPDDKGNWSWSRGPLLRAIAEGKSCIVLEEINRTQATQALGEVFSLLEEKYRGPQFPVTLRNGDKFFIPRETLFIATMNTLDKSTEDLDDAFIGRFAAVEFPSRVEDLVSMLQENGVPDEHARNVRELFSHIQQYYPLGHGYFADYKSGIDAIEYYRARIRPVLRSHLKDYRDQDLANIDEKVDQLFS